MLGYYRWALTYSGSVLGPLSAFFMMFEHYYWSKVCLPAYPNPYIGGLCGTKIAWLGAWTLLIGLGVAAFLLGLWGLHGSELRRTARRGILISVFLVIALIGALYLYLPSQPQSIPLPNFH